MLFVYNFEKNQIEFPNLPFLTWISTKNNKNIDLLDSKNKIDTIFIDEHSVEKFIYEISSSDSLPKSYLVSPENNVYYSTDTTNKVFYVLRKDQKRAWWVVHFPMFGKWEIVIDNPELLDSTRLFQFSAKIPPTLSVNNIIDSVIVIWNKIEEGKYEFFIDDDTTGFDGIYIGSSLGQNQKFTYTIPDTLNYCEFYVYYYFFDNDGNFREKKYLNEHLINPKPKLKIPLILKAIFNPFTNNTTIRWTCANDPNRVGFVLLTSDVNNRDSVLEVLPPEATETSILSDLTGKLVKLFAIDSDHNRSCITEKVVESLGITFEDCDIKLKPKQFKFINIPASNRGTVIRIDVDSFKIVGEYYTYPNGQGNPSRTTVDALGNVWVGNRNDNCGATKIALVVGGTRCDSLGRPNPNGLYLKPPFDWVSVGDWRKLDRNKDGLIKTSRGLLDTLPWKEKNAPDDELIVFNKLFN
ncbi:MAG: hypothetical protein ACK42Z_08455, partial [Candidatus Kapaibacteriota bacterium]